MNTENIKPRLIEISNNVKDKTHGAMNKASEFYGNHGKEVRLVANTGIYVAGAIVAGAATTTITKVAGISLAILGTIGLVGSAAEYWASGTKKQSA